ncbi:MFS transporter [Legionella bononiensis]|uniref:MFS transporter n=1 Tax=Legionella bononiensis TaxID=2793102 RepID=A0ABS1WF73_9GAMM|nr:MFS transporter [Legionella bononiensis]MBL7479270.1 MFS transporter [Legionella bononiensis]MBL7528002.1 MFS transporter [Legionella bononiensis]MBL7563921.1 MFS transporter [Legionella bononiensis]
MDQNRSNFRWVIVALLFIVTVINYIDRASIAYAIEDITKEFQLTEGQVGLVLGAFGVGYAVTTFLGGIAADRYGAKLTFIVAIFFWGVGSLFTGLATGFLMVFMARVVLGLAEGPNFPALSRAISDWLSESERTRALSLALISVPISLAVGGPIVSQLILMFSWRGTYYFLTVLALVWIPIWWWLFHDKPDDSPYVNQKELNYLKETVISEPNPNKNKITWYYLFTNKTLLANNWAFFVFGYYLFFFMTWLPSYLNQVYHLNLKQIGLYSIAPWLLAALMMWGVGGLSDTILKKTRSYRLSRSYPIFISQLLSAVCIIPVILINDIVYAMIFISLAVGFAMSANASYYAVNIDLVKEKAGTALGIMDAVFAIAGFLAPTLTGFTISLTGHFEAAFYLLALLALSSSIVTLVFHNRN